MACGCPACWCMRPAARADGGVCDDCVGGRHWEVGIEEIAPRLLVTAQPRPHRHVWDRTKTPVVCTRCNRERDEAKSRAGRASRKRGGSYELKVARALGGQKVGPLGLPEDVRAGMFNVQVKKYATARFPSWMTNELAKLSRTDARIPLLIVGEATGGHGKGRAVAVVLLDDWIGLHGEVVP